MRPPWPSIPFVSGLRRCRGGIPTKDSLIPLLRNLFTEAGVVAPAVSIKLAGFAPFRTAHINRFGDYTLDFRRKIGPLNFATTIIPMES